VQGVRFKKILTPPYRAPLSLQRRGEGGEDEKGPGVRMKRIVQGVRS